MKGYVYKITNIVTGDFYIGQTYSSKNRRRQHFRELKNGVHFNGRMQNSYNEYGKDNFCFSIIEEYLFPITYTKSYVKEYLLCVEIFYIMSLNPKYNISRVIEGNRLGHPIPKEGIRKGCEKRKRNAEERGYWYTPEQLERNKEITKMMNERRRGTHHSIESRIRVSQGKRKSTDKIVARRDGNIIGIFDMVLEASEKLNIKRRSISNNLNGWSKTSFGIVFTYENINNE